MWKAYIASRNKVAQLKWSLGGTDMFKFLRNVSKEMKKVSWPTGKELRNYTAIVLSTVILMAVFFFVVDLGISQFLNLF